MAIAVDVAYQDIRQYGSSISVTLTGVAAGASIVIVSSSVTGGTVTTDQSDTVERVYDTHSGFPGYTIVRSAVGGDTVITYTKNSGNSTLHLTAMSVTGLDTTANTFAGTPSKSTTGWNQRNSGNVTTSGEALFLGHIFVQNTARTFTAETGWTDMDDPTSANAYTQYRIETSGTTLSSQPGVSGNSNSTSYLVAFPAAAGGASFDGAAALSETNGALSGAGVITRFGSSGLSDSQGSMSGDGVITRFGSSGLSESLGDFSGLGIMTLRGSAAWTETHSLLGVGHNIATGSAGWFEDNQVLVAEGDNIPLGTATLDGAQGSLSGVGEVIDMSNTFVGDSTIRLVDGPTLLADSWDPSTAYSTSHLRWHAGTAYRKGTSDAGYNAICRGTYALPANSKIYAEFTTISASTAMRYGICLSTKTFTPGVGGAISGADCWGIGSSGNIFADGVAGINHATTAADGKVCQIAIDTGTGEIWFGEDGTWLNGGDPAAGTSPDTTADAGTYYFAVQCQVSSSGYIFNPGSQVYVHTLPTGFVKHYQVQPND